MTIATNFVAVAKIRHTAGGLRGLTGQIRVTFATRDSAEAWASRMLFVDGLRSGLGYVVLNAYTIEVAS